MDRRPRTVQSRAVADVDLGEARFAVLESDVPSVVQTDREVSQFAKVTSSLIDECPLHGRRAPSDTLPFCTTRARTARPPSKKMVRRSDGSKAAPKVSSPR